MLERSTTGPRVFHAAIIFAVVVVIVIIIIIIVVIMIFVIFIIIIYIIYVYMFVYVYVSILSLLHNIYTILIEIYKDLSHFIHIAESDKKVQLQRVDNFSCVHLLKDFHLRKHDLLVKKRY